LADIEQLVYYSTKFARLRVDRAHGIAPHKPILLLSVIELIKADAITKNQIYLSDELIQMFRLAWSYLGSELHHPDISRPFFHLRGDKFWHLVPNPGFRKVITAKIKLKTFHEEAPADMRSMRDFDGERILLPFQTAYNPRVESLQWHRDFWKIA